MSYLLCDKDAACTAAYDVIRANLLVRLGITPGEKANGSVLLTASLGEYPTAGEMSISLAASLARLGLRVLLVDADFRTAGLSPLMGEETANGKEPRATEIDKLFFLARPDTNKNPADLLGSAEFLYRLKEWREIYDMVLLNLPPVGVYTDALACAAYTDGVVLGVRPRKDKRATLTETLESLDTVGAKLLGMVSLA